MKQLAGIVITFMTIPNLISCNVPAAPVMALPGVSPREAAEYYYLRPETEKRLGYTHAVKIGNDIKVSGAVSMDENGNLLAPNDMEQQMKNCYIDLEFVLKHYGCTFDDVVVENIFVTSMADFHKVSAYRRSIYKKQFPTGTWLEVKGLALKGQLIEIEIQARKTN